MRRIELSLSYCPLGSKGTSIPPPDNAVHLLQALTSRLSILWACFLLSGGAAESAQATKLPPARVALVIGNARYEAAVGPLRNPRHDAKAVAKTLRSLGFTVIERHDLSRDRLLKAVEEFRKTLAGVEVALLYYAGHGISIAGANYLIPLKSGFDPQGAGDTTLRMLAETRLFNAEQAVADMSAAGAGCNLIVLDACRNSPLNQRGATRSTVPRGGLAEMIPPAGSLIAFATDAGRTALDGEGTNGLYTEELLKHLRTPGLTIEQVFKRTRAGVLKRSDGGQVPSEYSRLVGDDIYLAGPRIVESASSLASEKPPLPAPSLAQLTRLANAGRADECIEGLRMLVGERGRGSFAAPLLGTLLERVKDDLKRGSLPEDQIVAAAATCELVLLVLPECLPPADPAASALAAKAHNRRGDAMLELHRLEEALTEFNQASALAPDDPYILYNRGRAHLAMGREDEAKADFVAAGAPRFARTKAQKLALRALSEMK